MKSPQNCAFDITVKLLIALLLLTTNLAGANQGSVSTAATSVSTDPTCEIVLTNSPEFEPKTLFALEERALKTIEAARALAPDPQFIDISEETKIRWTGVKGPRALQDVIGENLFVATPSPTAKSPVVVAEMSPESMVPTYVEAPWKDKMVSTTVYYSLPLPKKNASGYMIGSEYEVTVVHMHGGGTPTATGANIRDMATFNNKRVVAMEGQDLPGHGKGTREIIDLFDIIDHKIRVTLKNTHPSVKFIVSGHSWGAMIALTMWLHQVELRKKYPEFYARILKFEILAPGIKEPKGFDQWWKQNFETFKDKIAPEDLEFQRNIRDHGKISLVGGHLTTHAGRRYQTPVLTPENTKDFTIPAHVRVATGDGVTFVEREKMFREIFAYMPEGSTYQEIGPGYTFASTDPTKIFITGHAMFPRFIDETYKPTPTGGSGKPLIYTQMLDDTLGAGYSDRDFSTQLPDPREPAEILRQYLINYSNLFPFREYLQGSVHYKQIKTPHLDVLTKQKPILEKYLKSIEAVKERKMKEFEAERPKRLAEILKRLGLEEKLQVDYAQWEVGLNPPTPERIAELENFVRSAREAEEKYTSTFKDPEFEEAKKQIWQKYQEFLEYYLGCSRIEDYRAHWEYYMNRANFPKDSPKWFTKDVDNIRSQLGKIHDEFTKALKKNRRRFSDGLNEKLAELKKPEGITDAKSAQKELKVDWSSLDRKEKLKQFLAEVPMVEEQLIQDREAAIALAIDELPRPEGIKDPVAAREAFDLVTSQLNYTYAPPGNARISAIVEKKKTLEAERERIQRFAGEDDPALTERLKALLAYLEKDKKDKKTEASLPTSLTQLIALLNGEEGLKVELHKKIQMLSALWMKGKLTSPAYEEQWLAFLQADKNYEKVDYELGDFMEKYAYESEERGISPNEALLVHRPQRLRELEQEFAKVKSEYLRVKQELANVALSEALKGNLQGPQGIVAEYTQIVRELVGGSEYVTTGKPAEGSFLYNVLAYEEKIESLRRRESTINAQIDYLEWMYTQEMATAGLPVGYQLERVVIADLFKRSYSELLQMIQSDAELQKMLLRDLSDWEKIWKERLTDSQYLRTVTPYPDTWVTQKRDSNRNP